MEPPAQYEREMRLAQIGWKSQNPRLYFQNIMALEAIGFPKTESLLRAPIFLLASDTEREKAEEFPPRIEPSFN